MIAFPEIDPVMVQIGPLALRWYGLMYTLAFLLGLPLLQYRAKRFMPHLTAEFLGDLVIWLLIGVVLGGRIGYVLFYNAGSYLDDPLAILRVWEGGMSFHGGFLGFFLIGAWYVRKHGHSVLEMADLIAPIGPLGLFLGRIGNFINGELWGRVTDVPWGMVFPGAGSLPRHPSQLYEAALEGIVLFVLLWVLGRRKRPAGFLLGTFVAGYGVARFAVEFFREPDAHLGLLGLGLSMGQWLSAPMALAGAFIMGWALHRDSNVNKT